MAIKDMAKDAISILVVAGILLIAFFIGLIRDGDQYKDFFTILATITITLISVSIVFIVYILQQHSNKVDEIRGVEAEISMLSQRGKENEALVNQLKKKQKADDLIWFDSIINSHISKEIIEF
jgi:amino acid permease